MKSGANVGNPKKVISPLLSAQASRACTRTSGWLFPGAIAFAAHSPLRGLRVAVGAESITLGSGYDCQRSCTCLRSSRACLLYKRQCDRANLRWTWHLLTQDHNKRRKSAALLRPRFGVASWFQSSGAIRSFQEAARLDPQCAMAHWGVALAAGPHINYALVPPPMAELAWKEITLAKQNASNASEVEQALIEALGKRYAYPQPEDRAPLDQAYADAMREVWKRFPNDVDVGALFAEAMMDLRPWNQWTVEGQPNPGTEEIIATLDAVLKLNPRHPFANHLYIHAVEASPHPERADAAADRLRKLQPGLAHNVHMPSHIDIRRGRWHEAIATNAKAVRPINVTAPRRAIGRSVYSPCTPHTISICSRTPRS